MKPPVLYVFNISHYCEKARWALDYFGIQHEARHVMPGAHRIIAKKLGARRGSVPFLQTDDGRLQGPPPSLTGVNFTTLASGQVCQAQTLQQCVRQRSGCSMTLWVFMFGVSTTPMSSPPPQRCAPFFPTGYRFFSEPQ